MQHYYRISPRLARIGMAWEKNKGYFWPIMTSPDSFTRLHLWG